MPPPPALEAIAHTGRLPRMVREPNPEVGAEPYYLRRAITAAERRLLRALVGGHIREEVEPFRAALRSDSTFILLVALDGLSHARLSFGYQDAPIPLEVVRVQDARFVGALLPEIARHATAPAPTRSLGGPSNVPVRAMRLLSLLAGLAPDTDVAEAALGALIKAVHIHGDPEREDLLGQVFQLRPAMSLTDAQRAALSDVVRERLVLERPPRKTDLVAAALDDPQLMVELAGTYGKTGTTRWIETLARERVPGTRARIRKTLEEGEGPLHAVERAAAALPDPGYVAALERLLDEDVYVAHAKPRLAALVAIGTPDAAAAIRRVVESAWRAEKPDLLAAAADSWLQIDDGAARWIRARMAKLPATHRVRLLEMLIKNGEPGLLPAARSFLDRSGNSLDVRGHGLLAIGHEVARAPDDDDALGVLREQLRGLHPKRNPGAFRWCAFNGLWPTLLRALRDGGRADVETETLLIDWLRAVPDEGETAREDVVMTLAELGGVRSIEALKRWCLFRRSDRPWTAQLRVLARAASARIAQRLAP